MFCEKCGHKYEPGQLFCEGCGTKLEAETVIEKSMTPVSNASIPHERKKMSFLGKFILLEAALLIIMFFVAVPFIKEKFSAEYKAEAYFASLASGNFKTAYHTLNLDSRSDNVFLSEESFNKYLQNLDFNRIVNYRIQKEFSDSSSEDKDVIRKSVLFSYITKSDFSEKTFVVDLIKNKKKKYFFFDDWSVDSSDLITELVTLNIEQDAKLSIDGMAISDKYRITGMEEGLDSYLIPAMFGGEHIIQISKEDKQTSKEVVSMNIDNFYRSFPPLNLSKEAGEKLQKLAVENMKLIYQSAQNGEPFEKIKHLFHNNAESLKIIEGQYNDLCTNLNNQDLQLRRLSFYNISTECPLYLNGVHLNFGYTIDFFYHKEPSWFSDGGWFEHSYSDSKHSTVSFVNEDGKWLMSENPFESLYMGYY